ncbi:MAG: oligopeptide transporter, OPT family [Bacteroidota bacterium]|nr:oligopeptide transporter, OPT family [Bacteroidota bacterium]MDP4214883.1 oligopeptide transporter, OPT family [Bacteroidota bacterium]MDP4244745.1 oligopeptide transporter, OPT family [Bacteroidota bacterium]MDP4252395.1 oligopeptide transporter, OPT family [Bacteroidota bacterium]MDP4257952.1 oligopeptide transporter, OPT family [Bacteroidota bacterium]
MAEKKFQPFVPAETQMKEFTFKALAMGSVFGILFGASTVYLALKAGLTVSASIPIAVLAITLGRKLFRTTILENNIIQTTGSASESIAAGVVFTLPGFLFLSTTDAANYFDYGVIFILAIFGGMLGTLMMIPLRRSLIVKEHETLPYPEGTACASVLKAGEKGGSFARTAFTGLGFAFVYALLQRMFKVVVDTPLFDTVNNKALNKIFPSAQVSADITPEYMGVGYIIGPRIAGILVAGSVLSWLVLQPLLASLIDPINIALQQVKLGFLTDIHKAGGQGGWNPLTHTFADPATAIYRAYVRQIGAGAVAMGGFITLIKTIPTIISSFKESIGGVREKGGDSRIRTERDLSMKVVLFGSIGLVVLISLLSIIPGDSILNRALIGILIVVFGAFFVTVSSRIVGLIGNSNNPISGMTIATVMSTCLIFLAIGWGGKAYEAMALVVGGMVCIAAANAGATSQDLKTGYLVGATPRYQQLALFIGVIVSAIAIGFTIKALDVPTADQAAKGIHHAIGTTYNAPQATMMATIINGIQTGNLDWNFVLAGVFLAFVMELCGVRALSFAIGVYLPISTTLPIFIGGAIRGMVDRLKKKRGIKSREGEEDLEKGNLYATGLVAGGALMGVVFALLGQWKWVADGLKKLSAQKFLTDWLGTPGYFVLGLGFFALMGYMLYRTGMQRDELPEEA